MPKGLCHTFYHHTSYTLQQVKIRQYGAISGFEKICNLAQTVWSNPTNEKNGEVASKHDGWGLVQVLYLESEEDNNKKAK